LGFVISIIIGLAAFARPVPRDAVVLYVSTQGNDAWTGKLAGPNASGSDGPLLTIAAARDAIRRLRDQGPLPKAVFVYLRGGTYFLSDPLVFSPHDSGTPSSPVVYAAYPGERAVLSGGRPVGGFEPEGGGPGSTKWKASIAAVKDENWCFHQLFVNGQRRQRARAPNTGFFTVEGELSNDKQSKLKFHDSDIDPEWGKAGDVEVVVLSAWEEFRLYLRSVDAAAHLATLSAQRTPWGVEKNPRYWVENAASALDAPGEWYLERGPGQLHYIPAAGEDLSKSEVIASRLGQLIRFEGNAEAGQSVHDITLSGLTFAHTDWSIPAAGYLDMQAAYDIPAAVELEGAARCAIEKCRFLHLGQYALEIHRGSRQVRVTGNEMADLGGGGVRLGDPGVPEKEVQATAYNEVSGNHIHDIGEVYPAAVGIWVGQSSGNTIAHNEIDHTYYTGISVGWTWGYGPTAAHANRLEFNLMHDIGRGMLSDMGCIYTLGVQPDTVERHNVCHDVTRYEHGYGGWGLYTDEGSSGILIENNLVYRTHDGGFHQHYGCNNMVRNNIFAFGKVAQVRRTRLEAHRSFSFVHNIVIWNEGPLLEGNWTDGNYWSDGNLYFRTDGKPFQFGTWSLEEWQKRGQDTHSLVADPLFRDAAHDDFRLEPGSPAGKLGFREFDARQAGTK
jgi:hypothetical protein